MKKVLATFAQFLLFLAVFAVGSLLNPFHMHWALASNSPATTRYFVPDGLLLVVGVFLAIVIVQAILKRIRYTPWTVAAFLLAIAIGYAMKLGFVTHDLL